MIIVFLVASLYLAVALMVGSQVAFNGIYPREKAHKQNLQHYNIDDIDFEGEDGVQIRGWFVESCNNPSGRTVILLHGLLRSRVGIVGQLKLLSDAGFHVLAYDQRSHGMSGKGLLSFGELEGNDALRALAYAQTNSRINLDKLGAVGLSLGSSAIINCAAKMNGRQFKAIVLEGVFEKSYDVGKKILSDIGGLRFAKCMGFLFLAPGVFVCSRGRWKHSETTKSVSQIEGCPILFIRGDNDNWAAQESANAVISSAKNAIVWRHKKGGHINALRTYPEEYKSRVLDFLNEHIPH
jgi:pimeloyl-ACP methyl ester carboxylesterase